MSLRGSETTEALSRAKRGNPLRLPRASPSQRLRRIATLPSVARNDREGIGAQPPEARGWVAEFSSFARVSNPSQAKFYRNLFLDSRRANLGAFTRLGCKVGRNRCFRINLSRARNSYEGSRGDCNLKVFPDQTVKGPLLAKTKFLCWW
jgi:hypothetical protein